MSSRQRVVSASLLAAATAAVIACGGAGNKGKATKVTDTTDAVKVSAVELFQAYKDNEVAANKKFKGKTVEVRGTVHSVKARYVELDENDGRFLLGLVHAALTGDSKGKMESLTKGQSIKVRGVCTGKSFAVDIKDAVLLD